VGTPAKPQARGSTDGEVGGNTKEFGTQHKRNGIVVYINGAHKKAPACFRIN